MGEIELTVGAGFRCVGKPLFNVPVWCRVLVTTTFTAPAACAAVVAVIEVLLDTHSRRRRASNCDRRSCQEARTRDGDRRAARRRSRGGEIELTVGAGLDRPWPLALKVAICMTQVLETSGAAAL